MDADLATEPAVAARKAAAGSARSELKVVALLAGGLFAFGAALERFVTPGPISIVLYVSLMSVALLATSYVVRGRMLDALAGFRLAAVTLTILALSAALGTLVLQGRPEAYYQAPPAMAPALVRAIWPAVAALILGLRLDDLFHNLWFGGLVALMNAGLVVSALRRWPVTRRNVGFFSVHLGILVTLAGAGVSSIFAVKGRIELHVGQAASTVMVTKSGLPSTPEVPLGASVHLSKFDVDHWADQPRVSLYVPNRKGGGYELKTTFENEPGLKHHLPEGASFRIKAYYPDLVMTERLVEGTGEDAVLKLRLEDRDELLVAGKHGRLDTRDGQVAVLFGWQRPSAKLDAPLHTLALKDSKDEPKPVRMGETVSVGGTQVKALRFFPHFTYDLGKKAAMNVSDTPVNPALEVEVGGKARWLFANMPGFGHGSEGPDLVYAFSPEGGSAAATVLSVSGADKSVLVHRPDGTEQTVPLKEGLEIQGVRFGALLEKAALVQEPGTASQEMKKPAVTVELTDAGGRASEALMVAGQRDPVEIGKSYLTFETHVDDVKAFRSEVQIRSGSEERTEIVAVNSPVSVGPWKLYQVNYDPKDPKYSGLEAVRDPGVNWVFVGFGLLFFGVVYMIYVAPRLRRKEA